MRDPVSCVLLEKTERKKDKSGDASSKTPGNSLCRPFPLMSSEMHPKLLSGMANRADARASTRSRESKDRSGSKVLKGKERIDKTGRKKSTGA